MKLQLVRAALLPLVFVGARKVSMLALQCRLKDAGVTLKAHVRKGPPCADSYLARDSSKEHVLDVTVVDDEAIILVVSSPKALLSSSV